MPLLESASSEKVGINTSHNRYVYSYPSNPVTRLWFHLCFFKPHYWGLRHKCYVWKWHGLIPNLNAINLMIYQIQHFCIYTQLQMLNCNRGSRGKIASTTLSWLPSKYFSEMQVQLVSIHHFFLETYCQEQILQMWLGQSSLSPDQLNFCYFLVGQTQTTLAEYSLQSSEVPCKI